MSTTANRTRNWFITVMTGIVKVVALITAEYTNDVVNSTTIITDEQISPFNN